MGPSHIPGLADGLESPPTFRHAPMLNGARRTTVGGQTAKSYFCSEANVRRWQKGKFVESDWAGLQDRTTPKTQRERIVKRTEAKTAESLLRRARARSARFLFKRHPVVGSARSPVYFCTMGIGPWGPISIPAPLSLIASITMHLSFRSVDYFPRLRF